MRARGGERGWLYGALRPRATEVQKETTMTLLRELRAILADYVDRIDRLGAETFRLRSESFGKWDRKQHSIRLCLQLLDEAVAAEEAGQLDELLRELSKSPRLTEANVAALHARIAELHRRQPELCPGEGCPCRHASRTEGR